MALNILIPDSAYSEQRVTVANTALTLIFKYNSRNSSWYLDIKDASGSIELISGLKIMPNQNITGRYIIEGFPEGNFWCMRVKSSFDPVSRDNLGIDKTYNLIWFDSGEEEEFGLDGVIQL